MTLIELLRTLNDNTSICIGDSDTSTRTPYTKVGNLVWSKLKRYENKKVFNVIATEDRIYVAVTKKKGGEG